jgi:hypothetical protein
LILNPAFYLSQQTPQAMPIAFDFEGQTWRLWPLDVPGIAAQLERWVVQRVRLNVELLRPMDDESNPAAWRVYEEDRKQAQQDIQAGKFGAFTSRWVKMIDDEWGLGFAEALYWCVSYKCDGRETNGERWTRERNARFMNLQDTDWPRFSEFYSSWLELNFPKVPRGSAIPPPASNGTTTPRSTGGITNGTQSLLASSPAN